MLLHGHEKQEKYKSCQCLDRDRSCPCQEKKKKSSKRTTIDRSEKKKVQAKIVMKQVKSSKLSKVKIKIVTLVGRRYNN